MDKENKARYITWGIAAFAILVPTATVFWVQTLRPELTITETARLPFNLFLIKANSDTLNGVGTTGTNILALGSNEQVLTVPLKSGTVPLRTGTVPSQSLNEGGEIVISNIQNSGIKDINVSDYEEPIRVSVGDNQRIVTYVATPDPSTMLTGSWTRLDANSIQLKPQLLNSGDTLTIGTFVVSKKGFLDHAVLKWYGHVRGIKGFNIVSAESGLVPQSPFAVSISYTNSQIVWLCVLGIIATFVLFLLFRDDVSRASIGMAIKYTCVSILGFGTGEVLLSVFITGVHVMNWIYSAPFLVIYFIALLIGLFRNIVKTKKSSSGTHGVTGTHGARSQQKTNRPRWPEHH